jgi:hypothetical protein
MKNYFARLVARATPPADSTPVASESTKVHDSFEQVAAPEMPELLPEPALESPSSATATIGPMASRATAEKRALPPVESASPTTTADGGKPWQSELSASPTQGQAGDSSALVASKRSESVETTPIRKSLGETKTEAESPLPSLINPVRTEAVHSRPHRLEPAETQRVDLPGEHDSVERFADTQREQAMLLRKADAFMNELFEKRARFESGRDLEEESELHQLESLRPLSQPVENPRLKPAQAAEATREADAEQSSLIIGKLTVEVTPPTLPSAPLQPQRIVVRGPRSIQSGVISSRRFGLGQF